MAESAAQLFARLGAKKSLGTLGLPLFTSLPSPGGGLCPGDVVEVMGGEGCGKSEVLLNITAQCVLPRRWRGREVGGREVEVVWVCTDYKFDVLRLVAVLEGKVCGTASESEKNKVASERCLQLLPTPKGQSHSLVDASVHSRPRVTQQSMHSAPAAAGADPDSDYKTFITSCLSRVHAIYCNSSTELGVTLQSLRHSFLQAHPDVCALVLDNVAEFYWMDRAEAGSVRGSELRQSVWVEALRLLVEEHHLVIFSARPLLFAQTTTQKAKGKGVVKSHPDDVMRVQWRQMIKYRFLLTSSTSRRTIQRVSPPSDTSHDFIISAQGIRFS